MNKIVKGIPVRKEKISLEERLEMDRVASRMKMLFDLPVIDQSIVNTYNKLEARWKELYAKQSVQEEE
jgi:hypothetical protein